MMFKQEVTRIHTVICTCLRLSFFSRLYHRQERRARPPTLLKTENATQAELMNEVNRFATRQFDAGEDGSEIRGQFLCRIWQQGGLSIRPTARSSSSGRRKILLKVQVPVIKTDVAQMTSDGEKFRVAILQDGGSGKYKKFVKGTNNADYSKLQKTLDEAERRTASSAKQNVNAFANLRPQHFTDAMLVRPTDRRASLYAEHDLSDRRGRRRIDKKSPLRKVMRGYYLLDEFAKRCDGELDDLAPVLVRPRRRHPSRAPADLRRARARSNRTSCTAEKGNLTDTGEYTEPAASDHGYAAARKNIR